VAGTIMNSVRRSAKLSVSFTSRISPREALAAIRGSETCERAIPKSAKGSCITRLE